MSIPVEKLIAHIHGVVTISEAEPGGYRLSGGGAGLFETVETPDGVRVSIACCGQKLEMLVTNEQIEAITSAIAVGRGERKRVPPS